MESLQPVSLTEIANEYNTAVSRCAELLHIDPICSRTEWIIPCANSFALESTPLVLSNPNGYISLLATQRPSGEVITGYDAVWGFAAPLVTETPADLVADLWKYLSARDIDVLVIPGIAEDGPLFEALLAREPMGALDSTQRCVAELSEGFDVWLSQRSSRFRRSLRQTMHSARRAGVSFVACDPQDSFELGDVLERIFQVESRSWKTEQDTGLVDTALGTFTKSMCLRFGRSRSLRAQFARCDGRDVGYVVGALVGGRYRGFQHSYDSEYRHLSIGKALQYFAIETLCSEGVCLYDMGMHMDYKESYADRIESTMSLVFPRDRFNI